jgi:hypothetical protein
MTTETTVRTYYHYSFRKTDLGYEVFNTKNGEIYFITDTEKNGLTCNCPATIKGGTQICKHKKYVRRLFVT